MPTWLITLDTAAPEIVWGAVDGASITETLTVEYLLDEPQVVSAELELADLRRVPMVVAPTHLSCVVPGDAPEGWGRVLALVRDDLDNEATRELAVHISGVLEPPTGPQPGPTLPHPPQGRDFHPVRVETPPGIARTGDDFTVRAVVATESRVRLRSRYIAPERRTVVLRSRLAVAETFTVLARSPELVTGAMLASEGRVIRRGEGPGAEDELLLLDIL